MIKYINGILTKLADKGLPLPTAYDNNSGKGSVTLLFAYLSFFTAIGCTIYITYKSPLEGGITAVSLAIVYSVLYRLRKLDKISISKESIQIDAGNSDNENP